MTDKREDRLSDVVRQTHSQISSSRSELGKRAAAAEVSGFPKGLVFVAVLWLSAIGVLGFQFDKVRTWLFLPSDEAVQTDLSRILEHTAVSIEQRRDDAGRLPLRLPNPALQGLVTYDRLDDVSFTLTSTVSDVTMRYQSSTGRAERIE